MGSAAVGDEFRFTDGLGPAKIIHVHEPRLGLKAVLVVDNVARGTSIGGLRIAPDVSTEECFRLARAMTLKNSAAREKGPRVGRLNHGVRGARRALVSAFLLLASGAAAQESGPPVVVGTTEQREVIEQVPLAGTMRSPRVAQLSTEVAGLVSAVLVDAGDHVKAGAPLVRMDRALARLALEAAEAATEQAREALAEARRRLAEAERLVKLSGITRTEVSTRETEVRLSAANLRLREAEQRSAAERLRRHEVSAPFSGVISRKLTEAGEWVTPGDAVLELVADQGLRIEFPVPQQFFPRVSADTSLEVRLDALPERVVQARIGEIVPVSDPNARTFLIHAYPEEAELPLTPGMSASATLKLRTGEQAVVVSRDALLRYPDGRISAWVVEGTGARAAVTERLVTTGLAFDGQVVIRSGLEAGTRVVVEGNEALKEGQRVLIREERR